MEKKEMLYEGKAKKVYATDVEDVYIVDYKDDATAFNGREKRNDCWKRCDQQPYDKLLVPEIGKSRRSYSFCRRT